MCCSRLCHLQGIPSLGELKLRYYQLMITYHQHYHSYLEICRCYKAIYESEGVQDDPAVWGPVSDSLFSATECGRVRSAVLLQLDWGKFLLDGALQCVCGSQGGGFAWLLGCCSADHIMLVAGYEM